MLILSFRRAAKSFGLPVSLNLASNSFRALAVLPIPFSDWAAAGLPVLGGFSVGAFLVSTTGLRPYMLFVA